MVDASHVCPVKASSFSLPWCSSAADGGTGCLLYWKTVPRMMMLQPCLEMFDRTWLRMHMASRTPHAFSALFRAWAFGASGMILTPGREVRYCRSPATSTWSP